MPPGSIIVARNLSAADLVDYDQSKIGGIVLEEGSATAHVTIVARAFDVPMLGRVSRAMAQIEGGVLLALDAEHGQVFLRPSDEVIDAFTSGQIDREHLNTLAVAINTGTNIPSVATPNGQAAFLFLLTSSLAPLIRLSYGRMVIMALPYTLSMGLTGWFCVAFFY